MVLLEFRRKRKKKMDKTSVDMCMSTSTSTSMSIVGFYYGEKSGALHGNDLATDPSISHSPALQQTTRPFAPVTPIHSAQHSLNSSISSRTRTPLQPLTLHEYRKQQSSPASISKASTHLISLNKKPPPRLSPATKLSFFLRISITPESTGCPGRRRKSCPRRDPRV